MSVRKIVINSCEDCPHKDHSGAYGDPAYKPICRSIGRRLGFTVEASNRSPRNLAVYDGKIPNWCPLERN